MLAPPMLPWCPMAAAEEPPPWAEVAVVLYELRGASALNAVTEKIGLGGAYHLGIEVYWLEWSYGLKSGGTGVHVVPIGRSPMGVFKERVSLGRTPLPPHEVFNILAHMRCEWRGQDYHLLRQNCGHFCTELARRLHVPGTIPKWATSLAEVGNWLSEWFGDPIEPPSDEALSDVDDVDGEGLLNLLRNDPVVAKNELEWHWAREHSMQRACLEQARHAAHQEYWGRMMAPPYWAPVSLDRPFMPF